MTGKKNLVCWVALLGAAMASAQSGTDSRPPRTVTESSVAAVALQDRTTIDNESTRATATEERIVDVPGAEDCPVDSPGRNTIDVHRLTDSDLPTANSLDALAREMTPSPPLAPSPETALLSSGVAWSHSRGLARSAPRRAKSMPSQSVGGPPGAGTATASPESVLGPTRDSTLGLASLLGPEATVRAERGCGDPSAGDCCEANGTPYCDDAECCEAVCLSMPYCCEEGGEGWDMFCAAAAMEDPNCHCGGGGGCGDPSAGDCCEANGTPYCDDAECCEAVCLSMPYCCEEGGEGWDMFCAEAAMEDPNCHCGGGGGCGDPTAGDCCDANGTPYCDDAECCEAVCLSMPYCCEEGGEGWDMFCAEAAMEDPNCHCGPSIGACCDPLTGICTDEVEAADCLAPLEFSPGILCHDLEPACGNPGACCDDWSGDGFCQDNVRERLCEGSRFLAGGSCADFEPPCGDLPEITFVFLETPTDPPPATLCECTTTPFADDIRPVWEEVDSVPSPCSVGGTIGFSLPMFHLEVPDTWSSWSHGYEGDVYLTTRYANEVTLTLPPGTCGFYFYVEPDEWAPVEFQVTVNDVLSSEPFTAHGSAGAAYVGVCASNIETITITKLAEDAFAVGEFGICCSCDPVYGACCDPATGNCTEETEATGCFPPLQFSAGMACSGFDPPCGNPGACCDRFTGECVSGTPEISCPEGSRFEAGVACEELEPSCGTPGCCCLDADEMLWVEYEAACLDVGGRFVPGLDESQCVAGAFEPPCGEWECRGILYAPTQADSPSWRQKLSELCACRVDYWDARSGTPTLADLREYCAVFTWVEYPYADNVAMGDVLADYVDATGKVILGQWTYPSIQDNALAGRIMTSAYCPVTSEGYRLDMTYAGDGTDCVWCNVNTFDPMVGDKCTIVEGAVSDGTMIVEGTGETFVAMAWRPDRRVYYSPGNTGPNGMPGDTAQLIANIYACDGPAAYGACCDPVTASCTSGVECAACPRENVFHTGVACEELAPPCGNPGCCCDEHAGTTSAVLEADCDGRFLPGLPAEECQTGAFNPPCGEYEPCQHSITMWDDWGDGWNGGYLEVYVNGDLALTEVTLADGSGPATVYFQAETYDEIVILWVQGAYPQEASYCVYDGFGDELGCDGVGHTVPVGITVVAGCDEPVCGDDVCAPLEDCCSCPADCGEYACLTQAPNQFGLVFSDLHCPGGSETGVQYAADNFIVCEGDVQEIDSLRFWGAYLPVGVTDPDAFTVVFRRNGADGSPGPIIATYGPNPATTKQTTGIHFGEVDEYEYTIDLEPNISLGGGTYWIQLHNNTPDSAEGGWAWETGELDTTVGIFNAALAQETPPAVWLPLRPAGELALEVTCTMCGDVNGDGRVNADDRSLIMEAFGTCDGQVGYLPDADLDRDGCITLVDYGMWLTCYHKAPS